ncbi:uncharacterized protein LOC111625027 [Centruroides sculpturatus]|uniref:uncharacterized protein LOC111625027 n=1 Tax=Centruroides sculpturatus TaxID=218467 RepID=UPI000C6DD9E3|nr:uncharacterized protein LOC111625027 [Centruroides sculpturatus]
MPCVPSLRFGTSTDYSRPEAGEIMSGILEIFKSTSNPGQRMFVRVYRTSSEHFAVLCPLRGVLTACRPLASLNLRSCSVEVLPGSGRQFRVTPRACEGVALIFRLPETDKSAGVEDRGIKLWLSAFTSQDESKSEGKKRKLSDHRQLLPVVVENDEEEEEHRI